MGNYSIAEGSQTATQATASHAEGLGTVATGNYQHVSGKYNILDSNFVEIVGGGTDNNNRANLRTLDWNGNETLVGLLTIGNSTSTDTHSVVVSNTTAGDVVLGATSSGHRGIYMRPHGTSTSGFWPIIADTNNVIEVYGQRVLAGKEDNSTDEGRFSARSSLGSIILHSDPNGVKGIRLAAHGTATDDSNIIFADTNNVVTFRGDQFIGSKYGDGTNAAFYATSDNPAFAAVSSKYADHYIELIYGTSGNYGLYTHDGTSGSWLIQKTQAGAVTIDDKTPVYTSTAQTIGGAKTFAGTATFTGYPKIKSTSAGTFPRLQFVNGLNDDEESAGIGLYLDGTHGRQSQFGIRMVSYSSSTYKNLAYREDYWLPSVTADRTANANYYILTTKTSGVYKSASNSSELSISSGVYTNLLSISITKGIWIISANVRMSGGGSGGMIIAGISDVSKDAQGGSNTSYTAIPATADNRSISMSRIYTISASKTIYLVGYQNSGSAKTVGANQCMIRAVCLSDIYTAG